jgi:hypothetical protein
MYGLQQEPWMGSAARGFYRAYSKQVFRTVKTPRYDKHFFYKNSQLDIMGFYKKHPKFHRSYGVDTIFMTRNYTPNARDSFETALRRWGMSYYVPQPIPRIFHKVPQKFFVWGDTEFLSALEPYQPPNPDNEPIRNV